MSLQSILLSESNLRLQCTNKSTTFLWMNSKWRGKCGSHSFEHRMKSKLVMVESLQPGFPEIILSIPLATFHFSRPILIFLPKNFKLAFVSVTQHSPSYSNSGKPLTVFLSSLAQESAHFILTRQVQAVNLHQDLKMKILTFLG